MSIPTEPIGSLPRPHALQLAFTEHAAGRLDDAELARVQGEAVADTLARLEKLGSPVLVDGDQGKPSSSRTPSPALRALRPTAPSSLSPTGTPGSCPS